jgi:hypothetical protein
MAVARSKAANQHGNVNIHTLVQNWWSSPQIPYVAHAFLNNGAIICLRPSISTAASNSAASHPDQQYWRVFTGGNHAAAAQAVTNSIAGAGGVANIARIDIDCKLMPCNANAHSCLYAVPALMRNLYGINNTPLRMFSHADEGMGGGGSSKRVITTNTSATPDQLLVAYNAHDGWGWTP